MKKAIKKLTIKKITQEIDARISSINGCYVLSQFASSGQLESLKDWILEHNESTKRNSRTKRWGNDKKIIKRKGC